MILFQASFVALTGYGIGVGLCAVIIWLARLNLPDYAAIITFGNLALALRAWWSSSRRSPATSACARC